MHSSNQTSLFASSIEGTATGSVPSLIKWTGSKRSQAFHIRAVMPRFSRYLEPFVGSGAVLYTVAGCDCLIADIYEPLVKIWEAVKTDPGSVVDHYEREWGLLQESLPEHYYAVRERFNRGRDPLDLNFLLRTCVNGIVRFNQAGQFNNSFHLSRKGMEPGRYRLIVEKWHNILATVDVKCQDYEATLADAKPGDFVYLDPPYAGNQQRYSSNLQLERFWSALEALNSRGVAWALSFDGERGGVDLAHPVPRELYRRHLLLHSGHSAVGKVLNANNQSVHESLYLSYE